MPDNYLEELPPSREMVNMYKNKLEKCRKDYDLLSSSIEILKSQIQDREKLEMKIEAMEENLRLTNCLLSKTQVLLLTERNNCQQMALHIDLLKKQHEMDREKLDMLLSLDGKPIANSYFQGELILKQHMAKMEKLMKEQSAKLLEERALMKAEWDKERHVNEKLKRELKQRVQFLQEKTAVEIHHKIRHNQKHIQDFVSGKSAMNEDYDFLHADERNSVCVTKMDHCSSQEMKRMKKKIEELQSELESYQKRCIAQQNVIQEAKEESQKRQEKSQAQIKAMKDTLDRLKEENNQLNKRRLNEGSGFRTEIKLLRDQLHRTQRQLCFLTMKKFDD